MCGLDKSAAVSCHSEQHYAEDAASNLGFDSQLQEEGLSFSNCCLLELAAENDLEGFHRRIEESNCKVDVVGSWYVRQNGSRRMVLERRTPAMIAALYGSLDVLDFIVKRYALCGGEFNQTCGHDGSTALHCAAAGGSEFALEAARILMESGADPTVCDAFGRQPCDVIDLPFWLEHIRKGLMEVLNPTRSGVADGKVGFELCDEPDKHLPPTHSDGSGSSPEDGNSAGALAFSPSASKVSSPGVSSVSSISPSSSPASLNVIRAKLANGGAEKVREYPIDPSLPDIKNGIFTTDEFRMYSFKIRPCSRAYSHDWTECPFVHPGENARRRDPRRYHYSCVVCPDFRNGSCKRGDNCEYAHGVFECWLHPAQYRTRFCKDGTSCNRRVCFFAHTAKELRSLYGSTGSSVLSPTSSAFVDMSWMSPSLTADFPSILSPYSHSQSAHSIHGIPPMSPSSCLNSFTGTRPHQSIPSLHLPSASLQSSRLRTSLMSHGPSVSDSLALIDFEGQNLNDFQSLPSQSLLCQAQLNAAVAASCGSSNATVSTGKYKTLGMNAVLNNMNEAFASENYLTPKSAGLDSSVYSEFEAQLVGQDQVPFSPVSTGTQLQTQQLDSETDFGCMAKSSAFSLGSLSRLSLVQGTEKPRTKEVSMLPAITSARAAFAQRDKRSHSSRDLGAKDIISPEWGSPSGKLEWSVHGEELFKLRKSSSFGFGRTEEPDLSWVQKLVKELPPETHSKAFHDNGVLTAQRESAELSLLGAWIDKLTLDQIGS